MTMDEGVTGLTSELDHDLGNQSDTSRSSDIIKPRKKKSKTLNRLRKLKKTNGTVSPSTGLSPRPPSGKSEDQGKNSSEGSLGDLLNHNEPSVTNGYVPDGTETDTPLKVNSAFVANVYFGGSPHRPSPPAKITDGKGTVADKPRPVPRRRIVTPPVSQENNAVEESQVSTQSKLKNDEPDLPGLSEVVPTGRKSSSTLNIREGLTSSQPVPSPSKAGTSAGLNGTAHSDAVTPKPVFVFDPATGEMVVKGSERKPISNALAANDSEDDSSEDDVVIPLSVNKSFNKTKTSRDNLPFQKESGVRTDQQKDGIKERLSSSNISESLTMPLKASTPLKPRNHVDQSLSLNGNLEDSDSEDDIIVVSMAHRSQKRTTSLPPVNTSETRQLVGKPESNSFITSSPLPVKQVIGTESSFIIKPPDTPSQPQSASQESGVESDRSSMGSTSPEETSSRPGTLSIDSKLPPIQSKHALPPLPPLYANHHLKEGERSGSLPFSEPVMAADDTLSMTNRSFMSTGALPTLTTKALKNRSYLSGGLQATNSLLGKEELERYFPDRQLKVFMATWNMHSEKVIPSNLEELLLPDDTVFVQDIYAIGTQESCPEKQEWEVYVQRVLGPTHVLLHSASHGVLNLLIFIRRDLIWFCSPIEEDRVSTRVGSMIKTKGAMAVAFNFFGTSLLFITSHLTSGDEKLKERVLDYEKIISTLQLPVKNSPIRTYNKSSTDVTAKFDCVFWCGDFNFRIDLQKERVEKWIVNMKKKDEPNFNKLLKEDQLIKAMKKKEVFKQFKEDEIRFFPTYKFDLNTDQYDTSPKSRVPSYTDRILYRSRKAGEVTPHVYNSCKSIKISDHRPVYAVFTAKIRPGRHDMPTGGGQFERNVFVEGNKRRVEAMKSEKSSSVCAIL